MRTSSTIALGLSALLPIAACERQWSGGLAGRAKMIASGPKQSRQIDLSGLLGGGDVASGAAADDQALVDLLAGGAGVAQQDQSVADLLAGGAGVAQQDQSVADLLAGGAGAVQQDQSIADLLSGTAPTSVVAVPQASASVAPVAGVAPAQGAGETIPVAGSDIVAVDDAEDFEGELGISVDGQGNAVNLGGDLGITQGSDGSTSVGGDAGINIVG